MGLDGLGGLGGLGGNNPSSNTQGQQPAGLGGLGGLGGGVGNPPSNNNAGKTVSLKKGQKVSLKKAAADVGLDGNTLSKIHVGLGWDTNKFDGKDFDLDAFTFAIKADGKVRDEKDFVFFGNKKPAGLGIELSGDNQTGQGSGDDEVVLADLQNIPADIMKIVFAITIYEGKERNQNFGMVENAFVRLVDQNTNKEFLRYDLSEDYSMETAVVVGELYRNNGEWKFSANGSGFNDGLPALCACYGVNAE
ncbi:TerD family protein [Marinisporobacter balticus]|uniref:Tellurium resistance protein TerD n=1 Tax=Marinisporobacter balticus TaxID=2018667 RepID=A0A4R2K8K1_9FIRM|nr:TerD family protein [Marinisporobacter balticus]TCO69703.1 tellurium resistance protein TerD [Marinisporobacter balticus]